MPTSPPLQVLIFRHRADEGTLPYEDAIVRSFQGGKEASDYLASGEDLGIQLEVFSEGSPPRGSVPETLDAFAHTLTIVLVDRVMLDSGKDALWDWLNNCWVHTSASAGRHAMLVFPLSEPAGDDFARKRPEFARLQRQEVQKLGERAQRPALLSLRVLHESRLLLSSALPITRRAGEPGGFLRLFISHAKMDGLPLAHSLRHQIQQFPWLDKFYDADDVPAGADWQKELENYVRSSLIIMLRSNIYDDRHWCQQEVLWADEYATPGVIIDARTRLQHPAAVLPFDRVPTARIPDGNLLRVLFLALRESLSFLHFMRRVEALRSAYGLPDAPHLQVFSLKPSMPALLRACQKLQSSSGTEERQVIIYPDPPFRTGIYEAAEALVAEYAPAASLVTPNTLVANSAGE